MARQSTFDELAAVDEVLSDNANHFCILNGFLEKKSLHIKKFRKRWMSLRAHYLFSYKTQMDEYSMKEPTEKIDLTEYEFIDASGLKFKLLTADRKKKRVFIAPNNNEQNNIITFFARLT